MPFNRVVSGEITQGATNAEKNNQETNTNTAINTGNTINTNSLPNIADTNTGATTMSSQDTKADTSTRDTTTLNDSQSQGSSGQNADSTQGTLQGNNGLTGDSQSAQAGDTGATNTDTSTSQNTQGSSGGTNTGSSHDVSNPNQNTGNAYRQDSTSTHTNSQANSTNDTTTNPTKPEHIQDSINKDMEMVDKELREEVLLKKQEALLNNPINPPQTITQADKDKLNKVYADLENALANNANFVIKTDLSLRGITELIAIMRILNDFYLYHVELLKDNKNNIENAVIDIEAMNKRFEIMVDIANSYIQEALKQMDNANNTSLELRKELEILHDLVQRDLLEIQDDLGKVEKTLEKLELLEANFGNLDSALKESELIVSKHEKILKEMKEFMAVELTKAIGELMLKKEEYERDLQATRDTFLDTFNELLRDLRTEGNNIIIATNELKINTIDSINAIADNRLAELKKLDIQIQTETTALKDNALADIQTKLTESLNSLTNKHHELKLESERIKAAYIKEVNDKGLEVLAEVETKRQDSLNEIKLKHNSAINEIQTLHTSTMQEITQNKTEAQNQYTDYTNTLTQKQTETISEITTLKEASKIAIAQDKAQALQDIENRKLQGISDIETKHNAATSEINTIKTDSITTIETLKNDTISHITNAKNETTTLITQGKDAILQEIDTKRTDSINEIDTKRTDSLNELQEEKAQALQEINTDRNAKVQEINDYLESSLENFKLFNKDMISQEYTSSTTWTPPQGVKNVFVNIRGGSGATNANTNGGISSFGSYVSVIGGAGNLNGAGQFGESKFMLISLATMDSISITIGSGGYCRISYF